METKDRNTDSIVKLLKALKKCTGNSFNKRTQFKQEPATIIRIIEEWELLISGLEFEGTTISVSSENGDSALSAKLYEGGRQPRAKVSKNIIEVVVEVPSEGEYIINVPKKIEVKKFSIGKDQQGDIELTDKFYVIKCKLKEGSNWIILHM